MNIEFMETSVAINLWHDINDDFFFLIENVIEKTKKLQTAENCNDVD